MKKLLILLFASLLIISCDKTGDRDLTNWVGTGVFHDTWGGVDNQSSISWDVTPISVDYVRNEITYLKIFVNAYYAEYKYSEIMSDEEFIRFIKNINKKDRESDIVNINDSIKCTWRLFDKVYNTYIK